MEGEEDLEQRFEELRQLGLSEQQIVDLVNQQLVRAASAGQRPRHEGSVALTAQSRPFEVPAGRPQPTSHADEPLALATEPVRDLVLSAVAEVVRHEMFEGPLPHPLFARQYQELCPGFVDREMRLREKLVEARVAMVERRDERMLRGQRYALIVALSMIVASIAFAWLGAPQAGAWLGGVTIVGLVSAFLYREIRAGRTRRTRQAKALPETKATDDARARS